MKNLYIYILLTISFFSCEKYVDILPKGNSIPSTVDDLAQMMNNSDYDSFSNTIVQVSISNPAMMTDDIYFSDSGPLFNFSTSSLIAKNKYIWAPYIYSINEEDPDWNKLYKSNYILNYILENIDLVREGKEYERSEIKGIAQFHRAMNYFLLVNEYAKQYDKVTALTDPGVPLVLESNVNNSHPRATVYEVYTAILADLDGAIQNMKIAENEYNHIPGKAAAYSLLARVNLFMGDYDAAYTNANSALSLKSLLIDYNTITEKVPGMSIAGINNYEQQGAKNKEVMYYRQAIGFGDGLVSEDLLSKFDKINDLRYNYMIANLAPFGMTGFIPYNFRVFSGIMTAEIWLTKAEAAVRKLSPSIPDAIAALNNVRINRLKSSGYMPINETNATTLLKIILDERRRETRFSVLRWFDLKRLNKETSTAKTITRTVLGQTYTLPPNSQLYVLPIPLNVLQFNKLTQNPAVGR